MDDEQTLLARKTESGQTNSLALRHNPNASDEY